MQTIGRVRSPYTERFGIPRQPGLVPAATGRLELLPPYDQDEALRGLAEFSHLWLIFEFHANAEEGWRPTVRPPRLGGNTRMGVFATRSPYRPNPIGLSLVELRGIERRGGTLCLDLGPVDLLDGTPVLDIKPHLPYADCPQDARAGFAEEMPAPTLAVRWTAEAEQQLVAHADRHPQLRTLIEQVLALDPRPAYARDDAARRYGLCLCGLDLRWTLGDGEAVIREVCERPVE